MAWYAWILTIFLALAVVFVVLLVVLGRRGLAKGRAARLARLGRLSARLSASWFGAKFRRLFASRARRTRLDEAQRKANAELVAGTMGEMKGAVMKLGQMLSFVTDSIPPEYRVALAKLQASAPPMEFAVLRDVAETELARPLERAFASFDEAPLAAASIGQVHRARLASGEDVVVKIQYPGVAEAIRADLANVGVLYGMIGMMYRGLDPKPVVEELRGRLLEELDYVREADNQRAFVARYTDHPYVRVPRVFETHSTGRVLTSEFVAGRRFAEILAAPQADRDRWGEILWRFVFSSIFRHGVFNGDPHPGNYLFGDDGKITFLDYGCVKYFPAPMLAGWTQLIRDHLAGDLVAFRARLVTLGFIKEETPLSAELLHEYFAYFYAPICKDEVFTFTREYNAQSIRMVFAPEGKFAGLTKKTNIPPDFVFVNRIQWGVYSIMAELGASANWHRIQREYLYGDAPSTPMGHAT